jgi:hypothetical protein
MTESLYIVAILWSIDAAQRLARADADTRRDTRMWLELGVAIAAGVLLRQVVLLMVPLVVGWVVWRRGQLTSGTKNVLRLTRRGSSLQGVALVGGVILLAVAPWTIRNYGAFGQFVPLNTNAGFAFYWGNHPVHGSDFIPILPGDGSSYGRLIPADLRLLNEAQLDSALLRRGLGFVVADPLRYLRLSLSRSKEFLRFWPTSDSGLGANLARALSFGLCMPFFVAGVALALGGRRRPPVTAPSSDQDPTLVLAFAAGYSLIHLLTWTLVRYRLPVDAVLIPFAAFAIVRLHDEIRLRPYVVAKRQLT